MLFIIILYYCNNKVIYDLFAQTEIVYNWLINEIGLEGQSHFLQVQLPKSHPGPPSL